MGGGGVFCQGVTRREGGLGLMIGFYVLRYFCKNGLGVW